MVKEIKGIKGDRTAKSSLSPQDKEDIVMESELTGKTEDSIDAMYRRVLKKYIENFKKIYFGTTFVDNTKQEFAKGGTLLEQSHVSWLFQTSKECPQNNN